jgi:hypothetical protein
LIRRKWSGIRAAILGWLDPSLAIVIRKKEATDSSSNQRHGVDFSMRGPLFLIGEFGFRRNHSKTSKGLSGNLKFGGCYNGGTATAFGSGAMDQPSEKRRRYGLYVLGDLQWSTGLTAEIFGERRRARQTHPSPFNISSGTLSRRSPRLARTRVGELLPSECRTARTRSSGWER